MIKILHIIMLLQFSIILTSCDLLGVEVTTVKGKWESEVDNNQYIIMNLLDNAMSFRIIHNDSVIVDISGTWSLQNDTLSLYKQDFKANGIKRLKIEQLSMNTLTLMDMSTEAILIMTRQYSTTSNGYDSHFSEVFDLKKGFWWYAWNIACLVFGVLLSGLLIIVLISLVQDLIKWVRKKLI